MGDDLEEKLEIDIKLSGRQLVKGELTFYSPFTRKAVAAFFERAVVPSFNEYFVQPGEQAELDETASPEENRPENGYTVLRLSDQPITLERHHALIISDVSLYSSLTPSHFSSSHRDFRQEITDEDDVSALDRTRKYLVPAERLLALSGDFNLGGHISFGFTTDSVQPQTSPTTHSRRTSTTELSYFDDGRESHTFVEYDSSQDPFILRRDQAVEVKAAAEMLEMHRDNFSPSRGLHNYKTPVNHEGDSNIPKGQTQFKVTAGGLEQLFIDRPEHDLGKVIVVDNDIIAHNLVDYLPGIHTAENPLVLERTDALTVKGAAASISKGVPEFVPSKTLGKAYVCNVTPLDHVVGHNRKKVPAELHRKMTQDWPLAIPGSIQYAWSKDELSTDLEASILGAQDIEPSTPADLGASIEPHGAPAESAQINLSTNHTYVTFDPRIHTTESPLVTSAKDCFWPKEIATYLGISPQEFRESRHYENLVQPLEEGDGTPPHPLLKNKVPASNLADVLDANQRLNSGTITFPWRESVAELPDDSPAEPTGPGQTYIQYEPLIHTEKAPLTVGQEHFFWSKELAAYFGQSAKEWRKGELYHEIRERIGEGDTNIPHQSLQYKVSATRLESALREHPELDNGTIIFPWRSVGESTDSSYAGSDVTDLKPIDTASDNRIEPTTDYTVSASSAAIEPDAPFEEGTSPTNIDTTNSPVPIATGVETIKKLSSDDDLEISVEEGGQTRTLAGPADKAPVASAPAQEPSQPVLEDYTLVHLVQNKAYMEGNDVITFDDAVRVTGKTHGKLLEIKPDYLRSIPGPDGKLQAVLTAPGLEHLIAQGEVKSERARHYIVQEGNQVRLDTQSAISMDTFIDIASELEELLPDNYIDSIDLYITRIPTPRDNGDPETRKEVVFAERLHEFFSEYGITTDRVEFVGFPEIQEDQYYVPTEERDSVFYFADSDSVLIPEKDVLRWLVKRDVRQTKTGLGTALSKLKGAATKLLRKEPSFRVYNGEGEEILFDDKQPRYHTAEGANNLLDGLRVQNKISYFQPQEYELRRGFTCESAGIEHIVVKIREEVTPSKTSVNVLPRSIPQLEDLPNQTETYTGLIRTLVQDHDYKMAEVRPAVKSLDSLSDEQRKGMVSIDDTTKQRHVHVGRFIQYLHQLKHQ